MNRYQIYLDPKSVDVLDELAKLTDLSRSQIIRDVISKMAQEYKKVLLATAPTREKNNPLLKMAGFAKGGKPGISRNVNQIYLKD